MPDGGVEFSLIVVTGKQTELHRAGFVFVKATVDASISLLQTAGLRRGLISDNISPNSFTDSSLDERPETGTKPAGLHPEHGGERMALNTAGSIKKPFCVV
ncbi:hypothetical protein PO909_007751 [Leuciscus waleckii]